MGGRTGGVASQEVGIREEAEIGATSIFSFSFLFPSGWLVTECTSTNRSSIPFQEFQTSGMNLETDWTSMCVCLFCIVRLHSLRVHNVFVRNISHYFSFSTHEKWIQSFSFVITLYLMLLFTCWEDSSQSHTALNCQPCTATTRPLHLDKGPYVIFFLSSSLSPSTSTWFSTPLS